MLFLALAYLTIYNLFYDYTILFVTILYETESITLFLKIQFTNFCKLIFLNYWQLTMFFPFPQVMLWIPCFY